MCIRDRYKSDGNILAKNYSVLGEKTNAETFYLYGTKFTSCLLYTSDAADERSSVDLGGRRIIKKKKRVYDGILHIYINITRVILNTYIV